MNTKPLVVCLLVVLLSVSARERLQGAEPPLPEFYGVYIFADGKLYNPDPKEKAFSTLTSVPVSRTEAQLKVHGATVNVPVLPASMNLLVFSKGDPVQVAAKLPLHQLSFVRRLTIQNGPHPPIVYQPRSWVAATDPGYVGVGETAIEMRFKPVKGQNEMVLAVPSTPLSPGVYSISGEFLFAVMPLDEAVAARCQEAALGGGVIGWRLSPCGNAGDQVSETPAKEPSGRIRGRRAGASGTGVGFIVSTNDVPVYADATTTETKARLAAGEAVANGKGTFLGSVKEFSLEESNGRTHIVYLENRHIRNGWVESKQLTRFDYDCSCSSNCSPLAMTMLQGSTWNECYERARQSNGQ